MSLLAGQSLGHSSVPPKLTIRSFGPTLEAIGESKFYFNRYLRKRGDANIKDLTDLINKSYAAAKTSATTLANSFLRYGLFSKGASASNSIVPDNSAPGKPDV